MRLLACLQTIDMLDYTLYMYSEELKFISSSLLSVHMSSCTVATKIHDIQQIFDLPLQKELYTSFLVSFRSLPPPVREDHWPLPLTILLTPSLCSAQTKPNQ